MEIKIVKTLNPKEKPEEDSLIFGVEFTDYMFEMDYTEGIGWHDAVIKPYGPIEIMPSAMVLHYAQEVFEGLNSFIPRKAMPCLTDERGVTLAKWAEFIYFSSL